MLDRMKSEVLMVPWAVFAKTPGSMWCTAFFSWQDSAVHSCLIILDLMKSALHQT
jgi:hypothetical protein